MRAWLKDPTATKGWLVVLNNINEETVGILHDILPRGKCQGQVLMTTRTAAIADLFTALEASSQLALRPPGIEDAVIMLSTGAQLAQGDIAEVNTANAGRLV